VRALTLDSPPRVSAALELLREHADAAGTAATPDSPGSVLARFDRHEEAVAHLENAVALFHDEDDPHMAADLTERHDAAAPSASINSSGSRHGSRRVRSW
jgi:hypothetical protein